MTRPIKFRAWDIDKRIMIHGVSHVQRDGLEVTQFTGLYDKNGAEIYESDIVRDSTCGNGTLLEVKFEEAGFSPFVQGSRYYCSDCDFSQARPELCEVIGNIYENPELLN